MFNEDKIKEILKEEVINKIEIDKKLKLIESNKVELTIEIKNISENELELFFENGLFKIDDFYFKKSEIEKTNNIILLKFVIDTNNNKILNILEERKQKNTLKPFPSPFR